VQEISNSSGYLWPIVSKTAIINSRAVTGNWTEASSVNMTPNRIAVSKVVGMRQSSAHAL